MFGLPLSVSTPSRVSNAQLVSVLVATASTLRLCATRSPVPVMLPAIATCPPLGHCLVTVNCVLIGKGAEVACAPDAPLPSTVTLNDAPSPKSVVPRVETASMSPASWFASAWVIILADTPVESLLHAATARRSAALQMRDDCLSIDLLRVERLGIRRFGTLDR